MHILKSAQLVFDLFCGWVDGANFLFLWLETITMRCVSRTVSVFMCALHLALKLILENVYEGVWQIYAFRKCTHVYVLCVFAAFHQRHTICIGNRPDIYGTLSPSLFVCVYVP